MDIQALKIYISEQELQDLAAKYQPPDAPVKNLTVRITPDGVSVAGEAPTPMLTLPFESVWRPRVEDGRVAVYLADLKAAGFPAKMLRALVLTLLKDAIHAPFVEVREDAVVVDVQEFVRRQELPVRLNFAVRAITCVLGGLVVEAGDADVAAAAMSPPSTAAPSPTAPGTDTQTAAPPP